MLHSRSVLQTSRQKTNETVVELKKKRRESIFLVVFVATVVDDVMLFFDLSILDDKSIIMPWVQFVRCGSLIKKLAMRC